MYLACCQEFTISQAGRNLWRLIDDLCVVDDSGNEIVRVPAGYTCDGSSIPTILWPIIGHPLQGPNGPLGFIHDRLYELQLFDRKTCDKIYADLLRRMGEPGWKCNACYLALRIFGWIAWSKKK